jgi:hypothetical protein
MKAWIRQNVDALVHLIYPGVCRPCGWDLFKGENGIWFKWLVNWGLAALSIFSIVV